MKKNGPEPPFFLLAELPFAALALEEDALGATGAAAGTAGRDGGVGEADPDRVGTSGTVTVKLLVPRRAAVFLAADFFATFFTGRFAVFFAVAFFATFFTGRFAVFFAAFLAVRFAAT